MQEMFLYIGKNREMLDSQKKPFWKESGNAGLTKETFLVCIQSMGAMVELASYLHKRHGFRYGKRYCFKTFAMAADCIEGCLMRVIARHRLVV